MKPETPIQKKRIDSAVHIALNRPEKDEVTYQHKVLAQTCLPYRNPGDDVTKWIRKGHNTALMIQAVDVLNADGDAVTVGLPYGAKARLLMIYINEQAVLQDSPLINVEEHMTAFLREVHGKSLDGRQINQYKNQMARLSACMFTMSVSDGHDKAMNKQGTIVDEFDLWFPKDDNQKVLWSSKIKLSEAYFSSLKKYIVPLNRNAVGALSNSAMGLDIYAWLAQRLHHIPEGEEQFVSWKNLKDQFGQGYKKMGKFKEIFRDTIDVVLMQYPQARSRFKEEHNKGYWMTRAVPPVPYRKSEKQLLKS